MFLLVNLVGVASSFEVGLTLFERIVLLTLLPDQGSYVTLKIVRDLQNELAPSEEEIALSGLRELPGGGIDAENWQVVPEKKVLFGDKAKELVVNALNKLDEEEKLKFEHFTLYEKFILEKIEESKEGE